jgi:hypothetical protein
MLTNLGSDARFSLRGIVRRPAFAVVVVLTLALSRRAGGGLSPRAPRVADRPGRRSQVRVTRVSSPGFR